jgi:hypothetical protein
VRKGEVNDFDYGIDELIEPVTFQGDAVEQNVATNLRRYQSTMKKIKKNSKRTVAYSNLQLKLAVSVFVESEAG